VLQERLLQILDRKDHWAWPWFAQGRVPLLRLLPHFQQEWEVYVRDFPILLARVLGHRPPANVAEALATNIYEEQTGGISGSAAHPELFLRMMEGCGFSRADFAQVKLSPAARAYRDFLDKTSWGTPWVIGAAVLTIFVEGSANERKELSEADAPQTDAQIAESILRHPLVRLHGLDPRFLELQRVHKKVEGGHRHDAWDGVLGNTAPAEQEAVAAALEEALRLWLAYRDEVVAACGVSR
jgi:pyrroloquinoline quinone (PQQ) biosynthesis protein C